MTLLSNAPAYPSKPPPTPVDRAAVRGSDFAQLCRTVRDAGLLHRRRLAYGIQIAATLGCYVFVCAAIAWLGNSWLQLLAAVLLGVVFTQTAFLGHDGGHQQVFAHRRANDVLGFLTGNLLVGLSYGWWVDKHNRHHANPNKEGRDPDIGDGVLVFTTDQVAARTGGLGRFITRRQAWLFFPLLTLEGFNLHVASVQSLVRGRTRSARGANRSVEILLLTVHLLGYLGGLLLVMSPAKAVAFIALHQAVFGLYMGCSFAPNHKGMPTIPPDAEVDYLRRQVLTSRNVRGGMVTDLVLGGLNYQIEHHLFPNMPRYSLRRAQRLVRAHCAHLNISYAESSLVGSYLTVLRYLDDLGGPLRAGLPAGMGHATPASPGPTSAS